MVVSVPRSLVLFSRLLVFVVFSCLSRAFFVLILSILLILKILIGF